MSDQAELLRKRREARQKKILASGESRLSKITGTAGTSTQVAPSPAVLQAREQLLKKEQEEERLRSLKAAGVADPSSGDANLQSTDTSGATQLMDEEDEDVLIPASPSLRAAANRTTRQRSSSSTSTATTTTTTTNTAAGTSKPTPATVQPDHDADPDDSLGAPSAHVFSSFGASSATQSPFGNNPFFSPQHQQALTRMMQEENGSGNGSKASVTQQQTPFGNVPPGFTVITPQVDQMARWWKLLHFVLSVFFALGVVYSEYNRHGDLDRFESLAVDKPLQYGVYQVAQIPMFWYFVTMELMLQSARMYLQGITASPSSTLGTIAGFLPSPFSDVVRVFMRYRLIWTSMANDMSVIVFIIGMTIALTHMFS